MRPATPSIVIRWGSRLLRFANFQKLIGMNIIQGLVNPRWPDYFYLRLLRRTQPEMHPLVAGRKITASRGRESRLPIHLHARAESIPVAASAAQRNDQRFELAASISQHPMSC